MQITLRPITSGNWRDCIRLQIYLCRRAPAHETIESAARFIAYGTHIEYRCSTRQSRTDISKSDSPLRSASI